MSYRNPKNGKVYLHMRQAPICGHFTFHDDPEKYCKEQCPIRKVAEKHNCERGQYCLDICDNYEDEVAELMGYETIRFEV